MLNLLKKIFLGIGAFILKFISNSLKNAIIVDDVRSAAKTISSIFKSSCND